MEWLVAMQLPSSEMRLLCGFVAVLISAIVTGLAGGLTTTIAACTAAWIWRSPTTTFADVEVLLIEGGLISAVCAAFQSMRRKASERLARSLKLEQQILEISDDERRRIGHDLHDGLGQHLTGISLLSETISQQLEAGVAPDRLAVETITRLVSEAVRITRDLAKSLSPMTLERDGFLAATEELAETASVLFNINCRWDCDEGDMPIDRTRSLHLYRIVQEAVNNSVRHGRAKNVYIGVRRYGNEALITVTDDGSGLSPKTMNRPGLGLRIMQYRARMLHASLAVERANASGGTVVTCRCPIDVSLIGSVTHVPERKLAV